MNGSERSERMKNRMIELLESDWSTIAQRVTTTALPILPHIRSRKLRSEILSSLFESKAAEYFNEHGIPVRACESDRDPDLTFLQTNKPLEIKVTGSNRMISKRFKWMGGKYSKRNSDHMFIAYCYTPSTPIEPIPTIKYFIAKCFVTKNDWKPGNENYYATFFSTDEINEREYKIMVGKYEMGVYQCQ